nr:PTS sugar transporter subunit IIA [Pirellulaceae bacterium]
MKFSSFILVDAIRADLKAEDKRSVVEELVGAIVAAGGVKADEQESIVQAVMKREELGSTGIGRGVAVPHSKHASVNRLIGTVGISRDGVDFNSLDGEKVQIFFLLVSPPDRPGD